MLDKAGFILTKIKRKCYAQNNDEIEYNTEDLTDNGKAQLASLQFVEVQMGKLNRNSRL